MQQTNLICYTVNTIYKLCSKKKTFNPQWIRKVSDQQDQNASLREKYLY